MNSKNLELTIVGCYDTESLYAIKNNGKVLAIITADTQDGIAKTKWSAAILEGANRNEIFNCNHCQTYSEMIEFVGKIVDFPEPLDCLEGADGKNYLFTHNDNLTCDRVVAYSNNDLRMIGWLEINHLDEEASFKILNRDIRKVSYQLANSKLPICNMAFLTSELSFSNQ